MSSDLSELKRTQGVEVGHKITECSEVLQNQVYKNPGSGSFFDSKDKGCVDTRIKKHIRADEVWMFPELTWIFFFSLMLINAGKMVVLQPFTTEAGVGCQNAIELEGRTSVSFPGNLKVPLVIPPPTQGNLGRIALSLWGLKGRNAPV